MRVGLFELSLRRKADFFHVGGKLRVPACGEVLGIAVDHQFACEIAESVLFHPLHSAGQEQLFHAVKSPERLGADFLDVCRDVDGFNLRKVEKRAVFDDFQGLRQKDLLDGVAVDEFTDVTKADPDRPFGDDEGLVFFDAFHWCTAFFGY